MITLYHCVQKVTQGCCQIKVCGFSSLLQQIECDFHYFQHTFAKKDIKHFETMKQISGSLQLSNE